VCAVELKRSGLTFISLEEAMASLNPKLDEYERIHLPDDRKWDLLSRLRNSYYYYRLNHKGSGLVELSTLLEKTRNTHILSCCTRMMYTVSI